MSVLADFDAAIAVITAQRGAVYGHPAKNLDDTARLWAVVLGVPVTALQVAQCMRMVKEARLINVPDHLDSLIDIAGYDRCAAMILDAQHRKIVGDPIEEQTFGPLDEKHD